MKTNLIGLNIRAFGYLKINLNLYEEKKNKNKKRPVFLVDAGAILQLGGTKFKQSLAYF